MKAITVMQPWAQLIVHGAKRYETRSWMTHFRGALAIHASREFPVSARVLCGREPFRSALCCEAGDLPLGAIVGVVELAGIFRTSEDVGLFGELEEFPATERVFGDFGPGRFAWLLREARALECPLPARGARSLWEWDDSALGLLFSCDPKNNQKNQKLLRR